MQSVPQLRLRLSAALTALGTLAVTLTLLGGVPYLLGRATGFPWPEHVTSLEEFVRRLAEPVSDPLMIDLLAVVGWVSWAAFAVTVIREICWYTLHLPQLLRDRRTHHDHVALLSARATLAALCIGTLVVALISMCRPETARVESSDSLGDAGTRTVGTAPLVPDPSGHAVSLAVSARPTAQNPGSDLAAWTLGTPDRSDAVRHVDYTVVDDDTLWGIADREMGDALKWPRIYALNTNRIQDDGGRLDDPDLIKPGWRLTIPVDQASIQPPAPSREATHPPSGTEEGHHTSSSQPSDQPEHPDRSAARTPDTPPPASLDLGQAGLIGITTAAGLLAARRYWYAHRRRHQPDTHDRAPALSPLVDKAAQAALAADRPRPAADTDALVTHRPAPQRPRDPDTVTIGVRHGVEVPLDELAVAGGCAWTGPGAMSAARALLVGILAAAERQRPGLPSITTVVTRALGDRLLPGLPSSFTALTQSGDIAEAIRTVEQHLIAHARRHIESGTPAVAGAVPTSHSAPAHTPGTLLLLAEPAAVHNGQLQALAARSRPGELIVLALNVPLPGAAGWQVTEDGMTTRTGGNERDRDDLRLFQITLDAGVEMTTVLLAAHEPSPSASPPPSSFAPPAADSTPEHDGEGSSGKAPAGAATIRTRDDEAPRSAQTKPVRLQVLGPITIHVRGHQEPVGTNLRSEVHEFLALLAAHPAGLLAHDIADKLDLDLTSESNGLKNLRRAVRRALRAATGVTTQEFVLLQGELHKLHPKLVETDVTDFSEYLKKATSALDAKDDQSSALVAAREAVALYRGPFAQGSDYLWAETIREHLATQAIDCALRLARQAEHTEKVSDEQAAILALLEHLGAIHPDHERLVQHTIRLYQDAGRHDAARHAYARLERHLASLDLEPEPATRSLIKPGPGPRLTP
ncbi:hypothetical protein Sm713_10530 [Streptomyces sp. TS71-3]|nr:hypothetical protein Sm713_10530 [Streptomyces sp. TS71-3]